MRVAAPASRVLPACCTAAVAPMTREPRGTLSLIFLRRRPSAGSPPGRGALDGPPCLPSAAPLRPRYPRPPPERSASRSLPRPSHRRAGQRSRGRVAYIFLAPTISARAIWSRQRQCPYATSAGGRAARTAAVQRGSASASLRGVIGTRNDRQLRSRDTREHLTVRNHVHHRDSHRLLHRDAARLRQS